MKGIGTIGGAAAVGLAVLLLAGPTLAYDSGSDGSDGDLLVSADTTLTAPEDGVFRFGTIEVQSGATLTFARNARNTPIYLLASGDVTISGAVDVSGQSPTTFYTFGVTGLGGLAGPGGGDGGSCWSPPDVTTLPGMGLGPGGGAGSSTGCGGGGAGPTYAGSKGNSYYCSSVLALEGLGWSDSKAPYHLHGGSGGGSGDYNQACVGGGGGGGVLVIAGSGVITIDGAIRARGGGMPQYLRGGGGGGGVVRLIADQMTGTGSIDVRGSGGGSCANGSSYPGGCGGAGVILIEAPLEGTQGAQFIADSRPGKSIGHTPTRPVFPFVHATLGPQAPRVEVYEVSVGGVVQTLAPLSDPSLHRLRLPQVFDAFGQTISVKLYAYYVDYPASGPLQVRMKTVGGDLFVADVAVLGTLEDGKIHDFIATFTDQMSGRIAAIEAFFGEAPTIPSDP